jgi:hypothetical protein
MMIVPPKFVQITKFFSDIDNGPNKLNIANWNKVTKKGIINCLPIIIFTLFFFCSRQNFIDLPKIISLIDKIRNDAIPDLIIHSFIFINYCIHHYQKLKYSFFF